MKKSNLALIGAGLIGFAVGWDFLDDVARTKGRVRNLEIYAEQLRVRMWNIERSIKNGK